MYFKQCHEPPWSEKKIVWNTWRSLVFGWNSSFALFTIQCPEQYSCSLLNSFADWTNGTRLPCAHSLTNSVCQAPVRRSSMAFFLFSLAHATRRGDLAISDMSRENCHGMESSWDLYPLIWGYRSEDNDADDGFWNLVLRSVNEYVLEPVLVIAEQPMYLVLMCTKTMFQEDCPSRLSSGLNGCCEVATYVEETLATPRIRG